MKIKIIMTEGPPIAADISGSIADFSLNTETWVIGPSHEPTAIINPKFVMAVFDAENVT